MEIDGVNVESMQKQECINLLKGKPSVEMILRLRQAHFTARHLSPPVIDSKGVLQEVGIIVLVHLNLKMAMYMLEILKMANIMEMVIIPLVRMVIFPVRFILASGYMAREMGQE